ncbi:MAG: VanW family protein [Limnohabitans sp.]|nr:VanW family protein [Limnohabitans sp.]
MLLKQLLPKKIKTSLILLKRRWKDGGIQFALTKSNLTSNFIISTTQEIKQGLYFENKVQNITLASQKINNLCIKPNETFSFWKIVGPTTPKRGFKEGRNIVNGIVSKEFGGGICQLSSIIYHTALKADLEIIERFNHSVDIYKEDERFTPLGADATVVYGYKDLRIKNNSSFPIRFDFQITNNIITCSIFSETAIIEKEVVFERDYATDKKVIVSTIINDLPKYKSEYKLP